MNHQLLTNIKEKCYLQL